MILIKIVPHLGLLSVGVGFLAQEGPAEKPKSTPFLKACTADNPPPCADHPPKLTYSADPDYSKQAIRERIEGTVVLIGIVELDGRFHDIRVLKSLGYGLDEEAVRGVSKWRFKPGKSSGRPVPVQIRIEVEFRYPYPR